MKLPQRHINDTKKLIEKTPKAVVAKWLLEEGYYPEQYVVPPCFNITKFKLKAMPYFAIDTSGVQPKFEPEKYDLVSV